MRNGFQGTNVLSFFFWFAYSSFSVFRVEKKMRIESILCIILLENNKKVITKKKKLESPIVVEWTVPGIFFADATDDYFSAAVFVLIAMTHSSPQDFKTVH